MPLIPDEHWAGKFCMCWSSHKRGITVNPRNAETRTLTGAPDLRYTGQPALPDLSAIHKPVSLIILCLKSLVHFVHWKTTSISHY